MASSASNKGIKMEENKKQDTFGNTFFGVVIAIMVCIFLFRGDPSIQESIRVILENYAELHSSKPSEN